MPRINSQRETSIIPRNRAQDTNRCEIKSADGWGNATIYRSINKLPTNNIIQPVILLIPRLKYQSQMQTTGWLRRTGRLNEDVCSVVALQVVPSVGGEDAGLDVGEAPVTSDV